MLLSFLATFILYKDSDDMEKDFSTIRACIFISCIAAGVCFFTWSRSVVYIDKFLFGGKVKKETVEVNDDDYGPGTDEVYRIRGISSTSENIVDYSFLVLIITVPYLSYRLYKKADQKRYAEKALHYKK
jgi:hypothetical protein